MRDAIRVQVPMRPPCSAALVLVFMLTTALACASHSPPGEPTPVPYQLLAPSVDRADVSEVERRGYDIYLRDVVANRGTDAARFETDLAASGAIGWIVVPYERGMLMRFIDREERSVIDVSVDPHAALSPYVVTNSPPKSLSERERSMWRARELVADQPFEACSDRYNSVIIPASDEPDSEWLVYMLAATIDPNLLVLGGHHRFRVDPKGKQVLEHTPLSKSCVAMMHTDTTVSIAISLAVSPEPLETHAYFNLLHAIPLRVFTVGERNRVWQIEGGRIREQDAD